MTTPALGRGYAGQGDTQRKIRAGQGRAHVPDLVAAVGIDTVSISILPIRVSFHGLE